MFRSLVILVLIFLSSFSFGQIKEVKIIAPDQVWLDDFLYQDEPPTFADIESYITNKRKKQKLKKYWKKETRRVGLFIMSLIRIHN